MALAEIKRGLCLSSLLGTKEKCSNYSPQAWLEVLTRDSLRQALKFMWIPPTSELRPKEPFPARRETFQSVDIRRSVGSSKGDHGRGRRLQIVCRGFGRTQGHGVNHAKWEKEWVFSPAPLSGDMPRSPRAKTHAYQKKKNERKIFPWKK